MDIIRSLKRDKVTRTKFIKVMLILFALQIGYRIPLPGINTEYLKTLFASITGNGVGGFLNAMTGSSFASMSLFALSISPYISASIVIQLLTVAIPQLEAIQKDGAVGHKKIEKLVRIVGSLFAFIEALAIAIGFGQKGLFFDYKWYVVAYSTIIWTAGAIFLMFLGEWITENLVGNGISLMLLFNMLSSLPGDAVVLYQTFAAGNNIGLQILFFVIAIAVAFCVFGYVVLLNGAEKRIKISSSRNATGKMMSMESNSLPLKLNQGGVMPIIFSSSILSIPVIISQFLNLDSNSWLIHVFAACSQSNWFNPTNWWYTLGVIPYILLTYVFSYFYMMISFSPKDIADNMRKSGTTIPGVRPGQPTADYLDQQAKSMLGLGTTMLMGVALLPTILSGLSQIGRLSFGGTTILIIVSVILETRSQLEAKTSSVNYKSLIRKRGQ